MFSKTLGILSVAAMAAVVGLSGCEQTATTKPDAMAHMANADSLYSRLGGEPTIRNIANGWVDRVAADSQLKARFANVNLDRYKASIIALLGEMTGGPQIYIGKDMKTEHKGMNISDAEWNAYMGDLKTTMDDLKIPALEREELLVKIEPMKGAIVGQ